MDAPIPTSSQPSVLPGISSTSITREEGFLPDKIPPISSETYSARIEGAEKKKYGGNVLTFFNGFIAGAVSTALTYTLSPLTYELVPGIIRKPVEEFIEDKLSPEKLGGAIESKLGTAFGAIINEGLEEEEKKELAISKGKAFKVGAAIGGVIGTPIGILGSIPMMLVAGLMALADPFGVLDEKDEKGDRSSTSVKIDKDKDKDKGIGEEETKITKTDTLETVIEIPTSETIPRYPKLKQKVEEEVGNFIPEEGKSKQQSYSSLLNHLVEIVIDHYENENYLKEEDQKEKEAFSLELLKKNRHDLLSAIQEDEFFSFLDEELKKIKT